jgi:hypothetical protein
MLMGVTLALPAAEIGKTRRGLTALQTYRAPAENQYGTHLLRCRNLVPLREIPQRELRNRTADVLREVEAGTTIHGTRTLIAATAAANGLAVYTHDADFESLPGVEVVVLRRDQERQRS